MKSLEGIYDTIVGLALLTMLVTTPEQRAQWARENDWNYHASEYVD